jgi:hypothetical protein
MKEGSEPIPKNMSSRPSAYVFNEDEISHVQIGAISIRMSVH